MEVAQHSEQEIAAGIDVCGPFLPAGRFLGQEPGKNYFLLLNLHISVTD